MNHSIALLLGLLLQTNDNLPDSEAGHELRLPADLTEALRNEWNLRCAEEDSDVSLHPVVYFDVEDGFYNAATNVPDLTIAIIDHDVQDEVCEEIAHRAEAMVNRKEAAGELCWIEPILVQHLSKEYGGLDDEAED